VAFSADLFGSVRGDKAYLLRALVVVQFQQEQSWKIKYGGGWKGENERSGIRLRIHMIILRQPSGQCGRAKVPKDEP
jgi:hypothetical protein